MRKRLIAGAIAMVAALTVMTTASWAGQFKTTGGNTYYLSDKGNKLTGYLRLASGTYYADENGVIAMGKWVGDSYFGTDGKMVTSQWVDGKWIDATGKFTGVVNNRGFVKTNGKTYYYDYRGKNVTGFINVSGKLYYLGTDQQLRTGWFNVGSNRYYGNKKTGELATNKWQGRCYMTATGAMAKGWHTIAGKRYYFDSKGIRAHKWTTISGKTYYFNKGVLITDAWVKIGKKVYRVGEDGQKLTGVQKIGNAYYYLSIKNGGTRLSGFCNDGKKRMYAAKGGILKMNTFFKAGKNTYYANADASLATGFKTIDGKHYFFDAKGRMQKKKKITVGKNVYFFSATGAATTSKWVKISKKYYYFGSDGKMARNAVVDGYVVNSEGVRTGEASSSTTGWSTVDGKTYYYKNGKKVTGLQTIGKATYYFDANGVRQTGAHKVGSSKYYFDTNGALVKSKTAIDGDVYYTMNASGVIITQQTLKVPGTSKGSQLAKYALQFLGNKYVYGGNDLYKGVDCSGFTQQVMLQYGIHIPRVADDQRKGYDAYGKKYTASKTVKVSELLPGDLIFYGSNGYATHVGIYIGNGKIVHASNSQAYPNGGVKISAYNYNTPIGIRRYWA